MRKLAFLLLFLLLSGCSAVPIKVDVYADKSVSEPPAITPTSPALVPVPNQTQAPAPKSKSAPTPSPTPEPTPRVVDFETELPPSSKNRVNNLKTAAKKLDGFVIEAGEEFSFNREVGPRTVKLGYREAPIIVNKKKEKGIGGGVCQVSTTVYNAALKMGLTITERHEHSKDVGYVEKGKDATVSYGALDLKFENNTKNGIKINCTADKKKVHVTLTEIIDS